MTRSQRGMPQQNEELMANQDLSQLSPLDDQPPTNELNLKVQRAQEQLLEIKRQQEELEKQKRDLEELSRKQSEFHEGRRDIVERLTRGMVVLERQEFESKRELEQIRLVRENFSEQLNLITSINTKDWPEAEINSELTKSLARVDQARSVHNQARARLTALRNVDEGEAAAEAADIDAPISSSYYTQDKTFGQMMRDGFAYSFPAFFLALVLMVIYLAAHHLLGA